MELLRGLESDDPDFDSVVYEKTSRYKEDEDIFIKV